MFFIRIAHLFLFVCLFLFPFFSLLHCYLCDLLCWLKGAIAHFLSYCVCVCGGGGANCRGRQRHHDRDEVMSLLGVFYYY